MGNSTSADGEMHKVSVPTSEPIVPACLHDGAFSHLETNWIYTSWSWEPHKSPSEAFAHFRKSQGPFHLCNFISRNAFLKSAAYSDNHNAYWTSMSMEQARESDLRIALHTRKESHRCCRVSTRSRNHLLK